MSSGQQSAEREGEGEKMPPFIQTFPAKRRYLREQRVIDI